MELGGHGARATVKKLLHPTTSTHIFNGSIVYILYIHPIRVHVHILQSYKITFKDVNFLQN